VVLRTYDDAAVWPVTGDDVAGALVGSVRPQAIGVASSLQGEAIGHTRDGAGLWTTSEVGPAGFDRPWPLDLLRRAPGTANPDGAPALGVGAPGAPPAGRRPWGVALVGAGALAGAASLVVIGATLVRRRRARYLPERAP